MFDLEPSSPTKPDEGVETREKSHGLADLPDGEVNDQLLAEAGAHGDPMEPKALDQLGNDLPDQPCPRTLDQPLASDAKCLRDEPEPLAPQTVATEKEKDEHGGAVAPEDTKEGGEESAPSAEPEDLFTAEVQTTRQEQFEERDRLAKQAPLTKKQAKAAAAKAKKAAEKEKAKVEKENQKALAKAKVKFQKERARAEKLAAKLAEKASQKKAKAAPKKKATKGRKTKSKEIRDEGTVETNEVQDGAPSVPADAEPRKPRTKKARQADTPGDGLAAAPEPRNPSKKREGEDLTDGTDHKESRKEKATFARRARGKGEKAGKRWDNIKAVFMNLVAPLVRRPSPFEALLSKGLGS